MSDVRKGNYYKDLDLKAEMEDVKLGSQCNNRQVNKVRNSVPHGLNWGYIEIIHTREKVVICSKISPKWDGLPITDFLPLYEISTNYRYDVNITCF